MVFILLQKFHQSVVSSGRLCILYLSFENLYNLSDSFVAFSGVFISDGLWAFKFWHIIPRFHSMLKLWSQEMFRFQYEVGYEKSFHYRDFQLFHNVQGFLQNAFILLQNSEGQKFLHSGWHYSQSLSFENLYK